MSRICLLLTMLFAVSAQAKAPTLPEIVAPFDEAFKPCDQVPAEKQEAHGIRVEMRRKMCGKVGAEVSKEYKGKQLVGLTSAAYGLEDDAAVAKALAVAEETTKKQECVVEKKDGIGDREKRTFYRCKGHRIEVSVARRDRLTDVVVIVRP